MSVSSFRRRNLASPRSPLRTPSRMRWMTMARMSPTSSAHSTESTWIHFGRGQYQGVTRDHYLEVDLGDDAPKSGPLYLIAQGSIHPTESSVNVAITQGSTALRAA